MAGACPRRVAARLFYQAPATVPNSLLCYVFVCFFSFKTVDYFILKLNQNGRMECCSIIGTWKMKGEDMIELQYGPIKETLFVCPAWDWERMEPTLALTGTDNQGICIFGRKITVKKTVKGNA